MEPTRGWVDGDDPEAMLKRLRGNVSERKLRLAAAAACRQVHPARWTALRQATVEVVERLADGEVGPAALAVARGEVLRGVKKDRQWEEGALLGLVQVAAFGAAWTAIRQGIFESDQDWREYAQAQSRARAWTAVMLRDVFGHLGREEVFDARWRTPDVVGLARTIYQLRSFDSLPVLGDALEEAGCGDAGLLGHLHAGGPHVRGCWALDLALGRE